MSLDSSSAQSSAQTSVPEFSPRLPEPTGYEPNFSYESLEPVPKMPLNKLHVTNLVSTFSLGRRITIATIARTYPHHMHFSSALAAGMLRLKQPRLACLIFNTGVVLVNGAKYEIQAVLAAWECCDVLRRCGIRNVSVNDFKMENITYTVEVGSAFGILAYFADFPSTCRYTPENFPTVTQRAKTSSLTMNFFDSAKIVVTGAKFVEEGVDAFADRFDVIKRYILYDPEAIRLQKVEIDRRTNEGKKRKLAKAEAKAAWEATFVAAGLPIPTNRRKRARAAEPRSADGGVETSAKRAK